MASANRVGRTLGLLLLVHLATGLIVPYVILQPLSASPGAFLETAAGMEPQVRFCILLLFVGGAIPIAISAAVWRIVRERNYMLGIWLLALSVVNFTLALIENSHWLTMLSVSQAYAEADVARAEHFRSLGYAIHSGWKWPHYSHIFIVVAWLFTFYALLFRGALVPRALSAFGMLTSVSQFIGITLPAFGGYRMPLQTVFGMPLGVAILALAVWLIAKGFHSGARAR